MSHIYAEAGQWDGVAKMRTMMRDRGLRKNPGCSWIEVKNIVHAFVTGDKSHPKWKEIYAMIETLDVQLKGVGYVPDTHYLLHGVKGKGNISSVLMVSSWQLLRVSNFLKTCSGISPGPRTFLWVVLDMGNKFISKIEG